MPKLSSAFTTGIILAIVGVLLALLHWLLVSIGNERPANIMYILQASQLCIGTSVIAFGADSFQVHKRQNGNGSKKQDETHEQH